MKKFNLSETEYQNYEAEVIRLRRLFHRIPEICYKEEKTAAKITELLQSYGITRVKRVFKTGVIALLGDETKECIALRMDMDALPVTEETNVEYASEIPGMMHACGHDAHIAILLMTAKILKEHENELPCCVKLIFQPGEEGDGGALPMIQAGVLENPKVSKVFGAHIWPETPLGTIEFVEEAAFAGCDRYEIHFAGKGGHGAMPDLVNSPLPAAAECILALQALGQKETDAVVSACAVHADGYHNVFPDNATLLGTIRTLKAEDRTRIFEEIKKLTQTISQTYQMPVDFQPVEEYPPCRNHPDALECYRKAAEETAEQVRFGKRTFAAEDFSYFAKHCPSAHARIGSNSGEATAYPLHNPKFNLDERCLMYGVKLFLQLIFDSSQEDFSI